MFSRNIDILAASVHEAWEPINNIETPNTEEEEVDSISYHFVDQLFDEEFYKELKSGKFWLFYLSLISYNNVFTNTMKIQYENPSVCRNSAYEAPLPSPMLTVFKAGSVMTWRPE